MHKDMYRKPRSFLLVGLIWIFWTREFSKADKVARTNPTTSKATLSTDLRSEGLVKKFTGYRAHERSLRMLYYNDLTVSVIEIGNKTNLINCEFIEVYSDNQREQLLKELEKVVSRPLQLSFNDMMDLMIQCDQLNSANPNNNLLRRPTHPKDSHDAGSTTTNQEDQFSATILSGIVPGTKWCGTGDIARDYFDLGPEWMMDKCCRKHDLCPSKVKAGGSRYNLNNKSVYTKSHCVCDDEFSRCLKQTKMSTADIMGSIYFNVLRVPCIQETKSGKKYRSAKPYNF